MEEQKNLNLEASDLEANAGPNEKLESVKKNLEALKTQATELSAVERKLKADEESFEKQVESARYVQLEGRFNEFRAALQDFDRKMAGFADQINNQALKLMQQIQANEQTLLSMGKIVASLSETLTSKGVISGDEVMAALTRSEDRREEENLNQMVNLGLLSIDQEVGPESVVVLRQEELAKDGSTKLVSDFRVLEVITLKKDENFRNDLIGKVAGDLVVLPEKDHTFSFLVKTVYKVNREGKKEITEEQV